MGELKNPRFWEALSSEALQALDRWCAVQPYDVDPIEWLDGGKSGSPVAVVARLKRGFNDQVAIKLVKYGEVNNWQDAVSDCPDDFRRQHLVDISILGQPSPSDKRWGIAILGIAGGDLSKFRPLAELQPNRGRSFATICKRLVTSIVTDWNPRPLDNSPETLSRTECLEYIFDSNRITPQKPLWDWLESNSIEPHAPLIPRQACPGEQLPNPLVLAVNIDQLDGGGQHGIHYGRAHGDLHSRNILVDINRPQSRNYKLIDLGEYNSKAPLARDPMHLLLSIALDWLNSGVTPGSPLSRSLMSTIISPHTQTEPKEYQEVSHAIHEAGREWAAIKGWGKQWTQQSLLFLVGAAMRYAARDIPEVNDPAATRGWFFDLAAVCARTYLEEVGLWDRYRQLSKDEGFYQPPRTSSHGTPEISEPQSLGAMDGVESSGGVDAEILPFRGSGRRVPTSETRTSAAYPDGQSRWQDLTEALHVAAFDSTDWYSLAKSAEPLLREIQRKRPPHPRSETEITDRLTRLSDTLNGAIRVGSSRAEVRSACTRADLIRNWVLDLLTEPKK